MVDLETCSPASRRRAGLFAYDRRSNPVGIRGVSCRMRNSKSGFAPWHGAPRWRTAQSANGFQSRPAMRCRKAVAGMLVASSRLKNFATPGPCGPFQVSPMGALFVRTKLVAGLILLFTTLCGPQCRVTIQADRARTISTTGAGVKLSM